MEEWHSANTSDPFRGKPSIEGKAPESDNCSGKAWMNLTYRSMLLHTVKPIERIEGKP